MCTHLTLLIPEKPDPERDAVADAWTQAGGSVIRLGRFWDPPTFPPEQVRLYGSESFCLILAQKLGLELCSPADDLLLTLDPKYLGRSVLKTQLATIHALPFPAFVKSLIPKQIASRVYASPTELQSACAGLDPATEFLVSDPIEIAAEARCFILHNTVLDCAFYENEADPDAARAFAAEVALSITLPRAVVMDIALLANRTWVVIEFNAAWAAGLNNCDPKKILPALESATFQ